MEPIETIRLELKKYVHPLLDFSVRDSEGSVELVIELKNKPPDIHTYYTCPFTRATWRARSFPGPCSG